MVNYRRVLCEVALLLFTAFYVNCAPHDCNKDDRVYDQRQNGSENYRLNIDGVVIAIAPAESLLSAVSDIDLSDLLSDLDTFEQDHKPKPPNQATDILIGEEPPLHKPDEKPAISKPEDKPSDVKPDDKPQDSKPEKPEAALVPEKLQEKEKAHKKSAQLRKQEGAQRLKHRLASLFLPFLRKRRHQ